MWIKTAIVLVCLSLLFTASQQETKVIAARGSATITEDSVNVREGPGLSYPLVSKVKKGQKYPILKEKNNWCQLLLPNEKKGWVANWLLKKKGTSHQDSANQGIVGKVTANRIYIRKEAAVNTKIIGAVNKGQSFTILAEVHNWDKIEYKSGKYGWIPSWYLDKSSSEFQDSSGQALKKSTVTILENGTNIRKRPNLQSNVIAHADKGEHFKVTNVKNNWYGIRQNDGSIGYLAGWMVTINGAAPRIEKPGAQTYLKNKTIVIDPGHGGQDKGTTGGEGTLEKNLTFRTATLLFVKLKAAGANAILTRNNDSFIPLPTRVRIASSEQADAFVSLHYDSNTKRGVRGMTSYYYHSNQQQLARYLYSSAVQQTRLKGRGIREGDFHVLRENSQNACLLELGYLSNPEEEMMMNSEKYQENAANGIFIGLARYFKEQ